MPVCSSLNGRAFTFTAMKNISSERVWIEIKKAVTMKRQPFFYEL